MKPIYLLDTNVISEFTKQNPNQNLIKKIEERDGFCAICATSWQKVTFIFELLPEDKRKQYLKESLLNIREFFEIIPYDSFAAQICGELQARCAKNGKPLARYDSQIAATAIANGMVLITHNTADYEALCENSMLKVEDWWEE